MQVEATYGLWELETVAVPDRSRLYSLPPIGIGTPQVESFSGYVTRLAEAHVLSVGDLVKRMQWKTAHGKSNSPTVCSAALRPGGQVFPSTRSGINGMSIRMRDWVRIFEQATCQPRLDALTTIALQEIVSDFLLFKRRRAWCPQCHAADRKLGIVYERLLWTFRAVTVCPIHLAPLEEQCPACRKQLPPIAVHFRPGHCSSCGTWLGPQDVFRVGNKAENSDHRFYVAAAMGELVADSSTWKRPSRATFRANLRMCVDRLTSGNMMAFAEFTGVSHTAIHYWLTGAVRPCIDMLLRLSFHLRMPAGTLLMSRGLPGVDWAGVATQFPNHDRGVKLQRTSAELKSALRAALRSDGCPSVPEVSRQLGYSETSQLYRVAPGLCHRITAKRQARTRTHWGRTPGANRICELDTIRCLLEKALAQDPPVPVRRLAMSLGYANGSSIQCEFPDLCRAIAQKSRACKRRQIEGLRAIVDAGLCDRPAPTLNQVARRLGFRNSVALRYWFPEEAARLLQARAIHAETRAMQLRDELLSILCRDPAPSLSGVARDLGRSVRTLQRKYPDVCRAIAARYLRIQKERTETRRQQLNKEIGRIVKELHANGQNPTDARIRSLLSEGALSEWRAFRSAARDAKKLLARLSERSPKLPA